MADIKAIIQSRHRIYAANQALWRFYSDCFSADPTWPSKVNPLSQAVAIAGGSGTGLRNYISRFHLETAPMYLSRVSRAVPVSISEHGVNFYTQTVCKPDSVITEVPDTYSFVLDDADGQGSSLLAFMREARTAAAV